MCHGFLWVVPCGRSSSQSQAGKVPRQPECGGPPGHCCQSLVTVPPGSPDSVPSRVGPAAHRRRSETIRRRRMIPAPGGSGRA
eukprot:765295-Hanusia_phi.AAC.1